jgi:hypothetical protein
LRKAIRERRPLDELHDQRRPRAAVFEAVDLCDVGMAQRRQHSRFTLEAGEPVRIAGERLGKDLDGDAPVEAGVARGIHLAHAAFAKRRHDLVDANASAVGEAQGRGRL